VIGEGAAQGSAGGHNPNNCEWIGTMKTTRSPVWRIALGKRLKDVPPGMWSRLAPFRTAQRVCISLVIGLFVLHLFAGLEVFHVAEIPRVIRAYTDHWLMPTFLVLTLALSIIRLVAVRRFCSDLFAHDFEICVECGYSLTGLPERHQCPECGKAYDMKETRLAWRRVFEPSSVSE